MSPVLSGSQWPVAGQTVLWLDGKPYSWQRTPAGAAGKLVVPDPRPGTVALAASYLESERWQRIRIEISAPGRHRVWLDGEAVESDWVTLTQGKHWLLIGSPAPPAPEPWQLQVNVIGQGREPALVWSLDPHRPPSWSELEQIPTITDVALDRAGRKAAWVFRTANRAADQWTARIAVTDLTAPASGGAQLALAGEATQPTWAPDGSRLAFVTRTDATQESGRDLWIWTPGQDAGVRVLVNQPGLDQIQWSPDGNWIYFLATEGGQRGRATQDPVRLTEVWHRWTNWPEKRTVYAFQPQSGTKVRLAGDDQYGVAGATLSPDGRRLALTRDVRLSQRPFVRSEIWIMELAEGRSYKLVDLTREVFNGPNTFAWSPDGRAIAFCASVRETDADSTHSVFQPELYLVSLDRPRLQRVATPSGGAVGQGLGCGRIRWGADGRLYVPVQLGARNVLARSAGTLLPQPQQARLEPLESPAPVMGAYDIGGSTAVAVFEGPTAPPRLFKTTGGRGEWQAIAGYVLADQLQLPTWQLWSFTDSDGFEIEGWYFTPPRFDPKAKYPLIVFYYGGTLPTSLTFSKRLVWYASQGYVVYVLNPAGTPGYGQKFADLHINDWGYPAGSDILEGVEKFLRDHPFVDGTKVGNFGHSYGGFMTMHLLTRSDRFAAAVSVAGISNIAGYWGAGWWGFSYTEGTCPGCYPWNRRDVFVERSPLFSADRIRTPLLLIHGTGDNNVVPTESEQIFTALRVLGRPVELVRVPGEDHGINSTPSAERLRDTLILEWFDWHLRDRPEAWRARWEGPAGAQGRGRMAR